MKKMAALILAATMAFSMCACGSSSNSASGTAEAYTAASDFVEAGYEGDCINQNAETLILCGDTYTWIAEFTVNQVSGIIVASTTTQYTGTFTVDSEADGTKTVTLSAPTSAVCNAAGTITTSEDDASILEDFTGGSYTLDTAAMAINQ